MRLWAGSRETHIWKERLEEVGKCLRSGMLMYCSQRERGGEGKDVSCIVDNTVMSN